MNPLALLGIADKIFAGIQLATSLAGALATASEGQRIIRAMKAEGRDPTPEEVAWIDGIVAGKLDKLNRDDV